MVESLAQLSLLQLPESITLEKANELIPALNIPDIPLLINALATSDLRYPLVFRLFAHFDQYFMFFYSHLLQPGGLEWFLLHLLSGSKNMNLMTLLDIKSLPKDPYKLKQLAQSLSLSPNLHFQRFGPATNCSLDEWIDKIHKIIKINPNTWNPCLHPNGPIPQILPISDEEARWIIDPVIEMDLEFDYSISQSWNNPELDQLLSLATLEPLNRSQEKRFLEIISEQPHLTNSFIAEFSIVASNNLNLGYELIILHQNSFQDDTKYKFLLI